jgi:hypothetical protein
MTLKVPRYWARAGREVELRSGQVLDLTRFGWSERSFEEALRSAQSGLEELVSRVMTGEKLDHYAYGVRAPLREELIQEIRQDGNLLGAVTRNAYGSLVLNTAQVMFADIDFPAVRKKGGLLARLFGAKKVEEADPADAALARVAEWASRNDRYSFRVYRTHSGLRLLFTSHTFNPTGPEARRILEELGSDPLYVKLCQVQECFRARLTPKPWRIGIESPKLSYPYANAQKEAQAAEWVSRYDIRRARFSTCRFKGEFGRREIHPEVGPVIELHDELCQVGINQPLA